MKSVQRVVTTVFAAYALPFAAQSLAQGIVCTTTNEASGNRLLWFHRNADGTLSEGGSVNTGGTGTGTGLGNQGALAAAPLWPVFYGVNAGSDTVTMFIRTVNGPVALLQAPSGGNRPVSVAVRGGLLY